MLCFPLNTGADNKLRLMLLYSKIILNYWKVVHTSLGVFNQGKEDTIYGH